jgi:DNA-binding CsgD family transcriptional regulator
VLVGRESECARVERLLSAARQGQGATLLVRGEAGIGKTELLRFAIASAEGLAALATTGVEAEVGRAYGGLAELLRPVLPERERLPAEQARILSGVLGLGGEEVAEAAAVAAAAFALVAESSPAVLVVDDAWWLDEASREVMMFLARRSDLGGFAAILAARDADAPGLRLRGVEELRLSGLSSREAAVLIESTTSLQPAAGVAQQLVAQTGGNPLALGELARLVTASELSGGSPLRSPLPAGETVEAIFASLVDALDRDARAAVLIAAASDRRELALLAAAVGGDTDAFERAEGDGVLEIHSGEVQFRHPLLRAVAYQRSSPREQRAAHASLARVEPDQERRARHLAAAATRADEDVAAALEAAAAQARRRGALGAAATSLSLAARLTPESGQRVQRWLEAARAAQEAGQPAAADRAADEVLAGTDDPQLETEAAYIKSKVLDVRGSSEEAARLLEAQAERIASVDPARSMFFLAEAVGCWFHAMEFGAALETARSCLTLDVSPSEDTLLRLTIGNALSNMGSCAEAAPILERAASEIEALDDLSTFSHFASTAATSLIHLERYDRARALLARQAEQERRVGALSVLLRTLALTASVEMYAGEWPAAAAAAEETARLASDLGETMMELWGHVMRATVAAAQGDELEREARFALAADLADAPGMRRVVDYNAAEARGVALIAAGDYEAAASSLGQLEDLDATGGASALSRWLPDLAEALARSDRRDKARDALARLEALHGDDGQKWAQAACERLHGLLEDEFEGWFERALERGAAARAPFERARTALCYGERLRRSGERRRSRAQLGDALATFSRLGARTWAERAQAELRASGQTRAPQRRYDAPLTPSEHQIATLVAEGLSNKEIATRLFVSVRTVEMHVSNAYRKLGVRSRTGLSRYVLTRQQPATEPAQRPKTTVVPR